MGLVESDELISNLAMLTVSKGNFVRLNKGKFDKFYSIGKILGIGMKLKFKITVGTFSEVRKCTSTVTH